MKIVIDNPKQGLIGDTDYSEYRYHPRMLELNILTTYVNFAKEYGVSKAEEFFKALCNLFGVDWVKISAIIRNIDRFKDQLKKDTLRYRQEMIFLGSTWGHQRLWTAKRHLHISHTTLYKFKDLLNPEKFVDEDWMNQLSNNVLICGIDAYKQEGKRFVDSLFHLMQIFGNVSVSKLRI
jgi:hypothetical protein